LHLKRLRSSSPQEEALYVGVSVLSKPSRYETTIELQTYRTLHKLERRRGTRHGAALTPPYVVDLEVSGMPEERGS
jgi:hypothetical protein